MRFADASDHDLKLSPLLCACTERDKDRDTPATSVCYNGVDLDEDYFQ